MLFWIHKLLKGACALSKKTSWGRSCSTFKVSGGRKQPRKKVVFSLKRRSCQQADKELLDLAWQSVIGIYQNIFSSLEALWINHISIPSGWEKEKYLECCTFHVLIFLKPQRMTSVQSPSPARLTCFCHRLFCSDNRCNNASVWLWCKLLLSRHRSWNTPALSGADMFSGGGLQHKGSSFPPRRAAKPFRSSAPCAVIGQGAERYVAVSCGKGQQLCDVDRSAWVRCWRPGGNAALRGGPTGALRMDAPA